MEQLNDFEAAVLAAGMSCVYNADDWHPASSALGSATNVGMERESSAQH